MRLTQRQRGVPKGFRLWGFTLWSSVQLYPHLVSALPRVARICIIIKKCALRASFFLSFFFFSFTLYELMVHTAIGKRIRIMLCLL
jgi:hypothetical protein